MCSFVVLIVTALFHGSSAFQWTSSAAIQNGAVLQACAGQTVSLPWGYTLDSQEHVIDVEWHYQAPGEDDKLIASSIQGNFLPIPEATQHLELLPVQNAGIDLRNVTMRDSGTYTVYVNYNLHGESHSETQTVVVVVSAPPVIQGDGHLEVRQLPNPVYDSLTQEWHVQLSCNGLVNLGSPPVSMVWVTPSGTVLPSTSNINGNFTLTVPNLPETGDYTCVPSNSSKSASCLGSSSPFHSGAAVHVDGVDARFRILESHMSLLLEENAALLQKVDNLSASNSFMGAALLAEERTNAELSQNVSSMAASIHVLQAENMNLKSEVDALSHQVVTLTGLEVGDRVVRGRDWDYSDQGGTGPGTVTAVPAPGRPGWVRVRWDTGEENNYRWGADGKFDLLRIP